jgi:hypothetical protein
MRRATWSAAVALGMLAGGCGGGESPSGPPATKDPALEPRVYLDSAINLMENAAYYRRRVDWPTVRATARTMAAGATTTAETYPAIRYALSALGDRHSFLVPPPAGTSASAVRAPLGMAGTLAATPPADSIDGEIVGARYGYLRVPTFGGNNDQAVLLADSLQFLVRVLDARTPCGWVIDLRHNLGGNMWPMLIGVGPLLGAVSVGSFVDADGGVLGWWYENGLAGASDGKYRLSPQRLRDAGHDGRRRRGPHGEAIRNRHSTGRRDPADGRSGDGRRDGARCHELARHAAGVYRRALRLGESRHTRAKRVYDGETNALAPRRFLVSHPASR